MGGGGNKQTSLFSICTDGKIKWTSRSCYLRSAKRLASAVNSEIFARTLFSRIALKDIVAMLKICDHDIIKLYQQTTA